MCISSVPRQNSTFPEENCALFIPPLSPKGVGEKWGLLSGQRGERLGEAEGCQGRRKGRLLYAGWLFCSRGNTVFSPLGSRMDTEVCTIQEDASVPLCFRKDTSEGQPARLRHYRRTDRQAKAVWRGNQPG